jgi:NAD(P)-dependent dehydrogenase (short-subunit alcohol dehydrogenase family)
MGVVLMFDTHRFSGRVAVVARGASGIGKATVRRLPAEGASVVAGDVDADGLDRLQGELGDVNHEARRMIEQAGGGAIVNVASICSQVPVFGAGSYCCAKAGIEMLIKVAALELGEHGIRVVAQPGRMQRSSGRRCPRIVYDDAGRVEVADVSSGSDRARHSASFSGCSSSSRIAARKRAASAP